MRDVDFQKHVSKIWIIGIGFLAVYNYFHLFIKKFTILFVILILLFIFVLSFI